MPVFDLVIPKANATPVLVEIPHAGLELPEDVQPAILTTPQSVLRDSDIYVDRLFSNAPNFGATLLSARTSRYVVDLNRAATDIDVRAVPGHPKAGSAPGRGVVWRANSEGALILQSTVTVEEFEDRIARFYVPYHQAIAEQITRLRDHFGHVIVLAAHSMPSVHHSGVDGRVMRRADIVPGTQGRASASNEVIDAVEKHCQASDLSVAHDDPYRGGFTTQQYGDPDNGCHVLQLEINRALYVEESTSKEKPAEFAKLKLTMDGLVERLGSLDL